MSAQPDALFDDNHEQWLDHVDPEYGNSLPYLYSKKYNVLALYQEQVQDGKINHVLWFGTSGVWGDHRTQTQTERLVDISSNRSTDI